jgi:hypothetical protein
VAYALAGRTTDALPLLEQAVEQAMMMRFMIDYALQVAWLTIWAKRTSRRCLGGRDAHAPRHRALHKRP